MSGVVDALTTRRPVRARPWDAGPEVTARDAGALRWIAEQYTARLDVAAVVLGRLSPAGPAYTALARASLT